MPVFGKTCGYFNHFYEKFKINKLTTFLSAEHNREMQTITTVSGQCPLSKKVNTLRRLVLYRRQHSKTLELHFRIF